ncbi:formylglycine-generating enzyme family protein [Thiovibrio sp. JS02]
MPSLFTLQGIDETLTNLELKPGTLKAELAKLIRSYLTDEQKLQTISSIPTDELIQRLYGTSSEEELKAKRKNFSSLKSGLNKSLKDLDKAGKNPAGIILGRDNVFIVSEERKDDLLKQLGLSADSPHLLHDMFDAFKKLLADTVTQENREEARNLLDELEGIRKSLLQMTDMEPPAPTSETGLATESGKPTGGESGEAVEEIELAEGEKFEIFATDEAAAEIEEIELAEGEELEILEGETIAEALSTEQAEEPGQDAAPGAEEIELAEGEELEILEGETIAEALSTEQAEEPGQDAAPGAEEIELAEGEELEILEGETIAEALPTEQAEEPGQDAAPGAEEIELAEGEELEILEGETIAEALSTEQAEEPGQDAAPGAEEIELAEGEELEILEGETIAEALPTEQAEEPGQDAAPGAEEIELAEGEELEILEGETIAEALSTEQAEEPGQDAAPGAEEIELAEGEELEILEGETIAEALPTEQAEEPGQDAAPGAEEIELAEGEEIQVIEGTEETGPPEEAPGTPRPLEVLSKYLEANEALNEERELLRETQEEFINQILDRFMPKFIKIPSGSYIVGSPLPRSLEQAQKKVTIPDFYLGQTPVTNDLFDLFVRETGYITDAEEAGYGIVYEGRFTKRIDQETGRETLTLTSGTIARHVSGANWRHPAGPGSSLEGKHNHPVVQVSHNDAMAFAAWAGKRLPTEEEWEAAARGADGQLFPWGKEWQEGLGNFEGACLGATTAVEHFGKKAMSPFGIIDLLGNVAEWTATSYQAGTAGSPGKSRDLVYILKGGSWISSGIVTAAHRQIESNRYWANTVGFRCAV